MSTKKEFEPQPFVSLVKASIVLRLIFQTVLVLILAYFPWWLGGLSDPGLLPILTTTLVLIFLTHLFFSLLKNRCQKDGQERACRRAIWFQQVIDLFLLNIFLVFFGGLNGPLSWLLVLAIFESVSALSLSLVRLTTGFVLATTIFEIVYTTLFLNFGFTPSFYLFLAIRLILYLLAGWFSGVVVRMILSARKAEVEARRSAERVGSIGKNLKTTKVKLEELSKLKDEFVSVASHELRAPMTTIKGYISMILDGDAGEVSERVKDYLSMAYESSERMIRLVNNMLNVSRIESGRLIMNLDDISIEEKIEAVVRAFSLEAQTHGLELKFFKPRKKLPKVRVDPDRVQEVIANLVGNAINYTPHGHVHIRTQLDGEKIIISVEDTGVGIAPEDQKELFKKFSQVGLTAPLKKGSGLGLYICRMLINEFGGDVWLKSKKGKGSTFFFSLPAIINHHDEEVN